MSALRSFVGISIDVAAATKISMALDAIKESDQQQAIRWVPRKNWHVTLAFLGNQEQETLAELPEHLAASLTGVSEFNVDLTRIDAFPDVSSRIVAARVSSIPELKLLHHNVYQALGALGIFASETQSFLPHVTLGRIRKGHSAVILPERVHALLKVQQITVFSSQRTPQGSIYSPLSSVALVKHR